MKKILASLLIVAAFGFVACNNEKKEDKSSDSTTPEKVETVKAPETPAAVTAAVAHVCTDACKDGNHTYAHNDVGHTCTEACGKAHACTDACKDGKHTYAHGDAGHTCTDACMKM